MTKGCAFWLGFVALVGCVGEEPAPGEGGQAGAPESGVARSATFALPAPATTIRPALPPTRSGSALVRTPDGSALLIADEDHAALRRVRLPIDPSQRVVSVDLPGAPAAVLSLGRRVLVTIRDPGLLLVMRDDNGALVEEARVAVSADAWGLAVASDLRTALVSSAWTHQVTAIDLDTLAVRWSANVAREPRGITITSGGVAYVSHLVGSRLTRIDDLSAAEPTISRVELPASPMRAHHGTALDASLGYATVLDGDESRLFAGRHALGGQSSQWWFGQATVDVLLTADDSPLSPSHQPNGFGSTFDMGTLSDIEGAVPLANAAFVQPRALAFRKSANTLLVASEGTNKLVELDARAVDPTLARTRTYDLGSYPQVEYPFAAIVTSGGAPSAIALSADETVAYVLCRSTYDVQVVPLAPHDRSAPPAKTALPPEKYTFIRFAEDSLPLEAANGRRLFYDATDSVISGGLGCAGCHPDGRDDGHVWHENVDENMTLANGYRGTTVISSMMRTFDRDGGPGTAGVSRGNARQTPILAGRVAPHGPYGWRGESPNLESRLRLGFSLHRWQGDHETEYQVTLDRPKQLAAFVRQGLVAPPSDPHELTEQERRGEAIFTSAKAACSTCHAPATGFSDRSVVLLERPRHRGFDAENEPFKTPSLLFAGGSPPYFHDGAATSLEELVERNGRQMGDTTGLGGEDRAALTAYLRTIGGYVPPFPAEPRPASLRPNDRTAHRAGRRPDHAFWQGIADPPYPGSPLPCSLRRSSNWYHVTCPQTAGTTGIQLLAGNASGTETWFGRGDDVGNRTGHVVFPLRAGERKVFQFTRNEFIGRWDITSSSALFVQAEWPEGAAEPTILFTMP